MQRQSLFTVVFSENNSKSTTSTCKNIHDAIRTNVSLSCLRPLRINDPPEMMSMRENCLFDQSHWVIYPKEELSKTQFSVVDIVSGTLIISTTKKNIKDPSSHVREDYPFKDIVLRHHAFSQATKDTSQTYISITRNMSHRQQR